MTSSILDLDIGNTFVKWRYGDAFGRFPTESFKTTDLVALCDSAPQRVRLSSVAGKAQVDRFCKDIYMHWDVVVEVAVASGYAAGVTNSYDNPGQMGVDRWLGVVAAFNEFSKPCCVVSCGTAITIDYVSEQGTHLGGYILPGARLLRSGLLDNTERVYAEAQNASWHHHGPGIDTDSAVTQGLNLILNSVAAEVSSSIVKRLGQHAILVICGGDAEQFHQLVGQGKVRPTLVLDGLPYLLP